ncbi:MAG: ABC transporter ATP-binding protein [Rubricoccaceae bacterium]
MPRPPVVDVRDVTRSLPLGDETIHILKGITFEIEPGEWVAITGPSGSGKSTLLGVVSGLDAPSSGRVHLDGMEVSNRSEAELAKVRNEKVGIVFQSFNLIPTLTALENVEAPLYVSAKRKQARQLASAMLERVGLADRMDHRPHQLSGGQQQRVAIARALVTEPALVVADEPTGNLDATTSAAVLDLFADLRRDLGLTLLVVTHDPDVAARADRIVNLVDGLIESDTRAKVTA